MQDFSAAKAIVRNAYQAIASDHQTRSTTLAQFYSDNILWRGFHPFNELVGINTVAERFWRPLRTSLKNLQRREDIFFAGQNQMDDFESTWVVSMGHLMGLFDEPFLGFGPTGKMAFLRYCEFNKIVGDKIVETAMYFDIPHLMAQAGSNPFPPQTAAQLVQPGPMTHDGLLFDSRPEQDGKATLELINAMINVSKMNFNKGEGGLSLEDELRQTWAEDMIWWGPTGIGATYTIERYIKQHCGPFRAGFTERSPVGHLARLAEGNYGGFFGWPNFTARPTGGFMGMPEAEKTGEFRIIDIYRRDGDKLAENWIFIDLLHFWKGFGVDILERTTREC